MNRRIGKLVGHEIVGPIVEGMDVDAIVNQVNVDELIERVDLDKVLARVDLNEVLSRVDLNALLDRVDVNRHLDRVDLHRLTDRIDVSAVLDRSNLADIISRSTSSVWMSVWDILHTRMAWVDQWIQRAAQGRCYSKQPLLPPRPGGRPKDASTPWPSQAKEFGVAVQFRSCGLCCRWVASGIDNVFVFFTFSLWTVAAVAVIRDLTRNPEWTLDDKFTGLYTFLYLLYAYCYTVSILGCFGRTIGMWIVGVLVVSRNGRRVSFTQACLRTLLVPLNFVAIGWVVSLLRRDGCMWNDLLSFTTEVYAWHARPPRKRLPDDLPMCFEDYMNSQSDTSKRDPFHHPKESVGIGSSPTVISGSDDVEIGE